MCQGGKGLASIQDSVDASIQRLENYIKNARGKTDYNDQEQYTQYKHQQNKNNKRNKNREKNCDVDTKKCLCG